MEKPLGNSAHMVHARAVAALTTALDLTPCQLLVQLRDWWAAWETHPSFAWYYDQMPRQNSPGWIYCPLVRVMFVHEPGLQKATESFVITDAQDALFQIKWGERTLGTFDGFDPVCVDPPDPISPWRGVVVSFSYKGAGGAMHARKALRSLLPPVLRPWISKARTANRKYRKYDGLRQWWADEGMDPVTEFSARVRKYGKVQHWPREAFPDWYTTTRKWQLWMHYRVPQDVQARIQDFMTLESFWQASTGRMHPDDVASHVLHQPRLFCEEE